MSHRRSGRRSGKKHNKSRRTLEREKYNKAKRVKELERRRTKRLRVKESDKARDQRMATELASAAEEQRQRNAETAAQWQRMVDSGHIWWRIVRQGWMRGLWNAQPDIRSPNLYGLLRRIITVGQAYYDLHMSPEAQQFGCTHGTLLITGRWDGVEFWLPQALTPHEQAIIAQLTSVADTWRKLPYPHRLWSLQLEIELFNAQWHGNLPEADPWGLYQDEEWRPPTYAASDVATA